MNEEQEQEAFAFCTHYAIMRYGLEHRPWEQLKDAIILAVAAMQHAWKIEATDANQQKAEALVKRIRAHVYETDYRNILAYCYQYQQRAKEE